MGFHEVRFPANLSFGSVGGPERRTDIVTLANGFEERNSPWRHARRRYDAGVSMRPPADVHPPLACFASRQGQRPVPSGGNGRPINLRCPLSISAVTACLSRRRP